MNTSTTRRFVLLAAMIGLLLLGLVGLTGRSTFAAPIADRGVTVTLLQDPDQAVPPGGIFTYTIKVANHGPGWAYDTSVRILLELDAPGIAAVEG